MGNKKKAEILDITEEIIKELIENGYAIRIDKNKIKLTEKGIKLCKSGLLHDGKNLPRA